MSEMWKRSISKHGSTEDHIITLHWLPQVRWIKSWKESVDSEWPTIPPYQQSNNKSRNPPANKTKQKQHTITSYQNTTTYDVGIPCPLLGQGHQCGGSKPIYWITFKDSPTENTVKKTCRDPLLLNRGTYYHKNEWQHKHGQYNGMVNE